MATKEVPLTRGQVAIVDARDHHLVSLHKWQAHPQKAGGFRARRQHRLPGTDRKLTITLAHVIAGAGPTDAVRHLNGDTLDCTRENLEVVPRRGLMPIEPNTGRRVPKPGASIPQDTDPLDEEYTA